MRRKCKGRDEVAASHSPDIEHTNADVDHNFPSEEFQQIGVVAAWIVARIAARHRLQKCRAALIADVAGLGGRAA